MESWLPIAGFEGRYDVSDTGRVRTVKTGLIRCGTTTPTQLYPALFLGRGNQRYVHDLVAAAFIGPKPSGMDVLHGNDRPTDNRAVNLSYGTRQKNIRDMVARGRHRTARIDRCPESHPYDEENTYRNTKGARVCRACKRDRYHAQKITRRNGVAA